MDKKSGTLRLSSPVTFRKTDFGFNELLRFMLNAESGSTSFILYDYEEGVLTQKLSGIKAPLGKEEKERLGSGLTPIVRDDEDAAVPEGRYLLRDFPDLAEESALPEILSPIMKEKGARNEVWVRLYKENTLELVMQALRPLL